MGDVFIVEVLIPMLNELIRQVISFVDAKDEFFVSFMFLDIFSLSKALDLDLTSWSLTVVCPDLLSGISLL